MADPTPAAPDPYPRLVTDGDMPRDWWALYDESTKHFIASGPACVETLAGHAWSRAEMVCQVRAHAQRLASQQVTAAAPDQAEGPRETRLMCAWCAQGYPLLADGKTHSLQLDEGGFRLTFATCLAPAQMRAPYDPVLDREIL